MVKKLNEDFTKKIAEAEALKKDLFKAERTVETASSLLEKLKEEKVRWESDKDTIVE